MGLIGLRLGMVPLITSETLFSFAPQRSWRVGKWAAGEQGQYPWFACDRGGWFGKGHPGQSFRTHGEAVAYAHRMAVSLPLV